MTHAVPTALYIRISYDDLLVYALNELINEGKQPVFENLVAKTFELFPKRFQLPGYPHWPDSSLVEKSWLRCRTDKNLINGSKSKGFSLTDKGLMLSHNLRDKFGKELGGREKIILKGDKKTKSGRLVSHIEKSIAYRKYIVQKNVLGITDFEFCDLLYTTLDTKPSLRRRSLAELKYHASVYERTDLLAFLEQCENHFDKLLMDPRDSYYQGGMMRRKKNERT